MTIPPAGRADIFLTVVGKTGAIKGESRDESHKEAIELVSWSWGLSHKGSLGGVATGKATIHELRVVKRVDVASTKLMSALRSNEPIKAVLSQRKAGKDPLDFLTITIEQGLVTSLTIDSDESGGPDLLERVNFSFNKITVDYKPQGEHGGSTGATSFTDEFHHQ